MTDEKPLTLSSQRAQRGKRRTLGQICVIHYNQNKSENHVVQLCNSSYQKIKEAAEVRKTHGRTQTEKLKDICSSIPEEYSPHCHGYHRWCYKNFTNISRLLKRKAPFHDDDNAGPSTSKKSRLSKPSGTRVLFPADKCLFCEKNRITKKHQIEKLVKCVTKTAEDSIKEAASKKQDEHILGKVQDIDLVAREVHYHASCRKDYTREAERHGTAPKDEDEIRKQTAHKAAFDYIVKYVKESIFEGANVERMTMLKEKYQQFMLENSPQFYNKDYKTENLKHKLEKEFGKDIQFWQPNYRSELVYSSHVPKGQAVESAFEVAASDSKRLQEAALVLRRLIHTAYEESVKCPWPPSATFLKSGAIGPPACVKQFFSVVLTGKSQDISEVNSGRVNSFSQDICQAATRGQWVMPKHLLIGLTLRHLTGSAQVVTLIHRLGHCSSYSSILELETAMCRDIEERDSLIPLAILPHQNIVTHFCWDNFDLLEETPSGAGTTHTAHGLIIQETKSTTDTPDEPPAHLPKTKERSFACTPAELEPCYLKDKCEPTLNLTETAKAPAISEEVKSTGLLWISCRAVKASPSPTVPGWAGWISLTSADSEESTRLSTIEYMAPIFAPITDSSTVQHILRISQEASKQVSQTYTIVTFDLAVAKKAYAIVWQNQHEFRNVIVRMGAFHLTSAYMNALGKSLKGSGFEEILIESGVCASGSIDQVMNGKHFNRAIRVHKVVLEALERLLLEAFEMSEADFLDDETRAVLLCLAKDPTEEKLAESLQNDSCRNLLQRLSDFRTRVLQGHLGKTAQFWMRYVDRVWNILNFQLATKENNLNLHLGCLEKMVSLFFSYDHQNYARYTAVYLQTVLNLPTTHPGAEKLLAEKGISVNRSVAPSSRNAVDITIEQTINRHAKSQSGIIGFSRNRSAYYRWCKTRHARASYHQAAMEMANMDSNENSSHKDIRPAEIRKSEEATNAVMNAIRSFTNPFDVDNKEVLYCLSSGAPAPKDVEEDLLNADLIGQKAYQTFVSDRLVSKETSFNAPIKKQKLKTFSKMAKKVKVSGTSKKSKQVTAERNMFAQLVHLAINHQISLERALCFPLGPVPWALGTADGAPARTDKSKLMHSLEANSQCVEKPAVATNSCIIDGNALLQAQVHLPDTFGQLAESVFRQLPDVPRVDFVTDSYFPQSIKSLERERRGRSQAHLIKGQNTTVPRDWKTFLTCEENKTSLVRFLLTQWTNDIYASKLFRKDIFFVCEGKCIHLTSLNGETVLKEEVEELNSTHEEADTKIILHCLHVAAKTSESSTITIRSPDTDVFVLLLRFAQRIEQSVFFDTGVGNKRRLIDIRKVIAENGKKLCFLLPAVHAYTGCDTTSAFVKKGKLTALKLLRQQPEHLKAFAQLGISAELPDSLYRELELFTCRLYGGMAVTDINKLRFQKFQDRFSSSQTDLLNSYNGVDMSLLPPCQDSLTMHIQRANFQALIWNSADVAAPNLPSADGHGWQSEAGKLQIKWTGGFLMPQELADILMDQPEQEEMEEDENPPDFVNFEDVYFDDV